MTVSVISPPCETQGAASETLMALPISGPVNSAESTTYGLKTRSKWKQATPFDRPLPYSMDEYHGVQTHSSWTVSGVHSTVTSRNINFSVTGQPDFFSKRTAAYNQAYARLKDRSGPSSGWLENIATVNKSRLLLAESAFRLGAVVGSLRKGRFDEAAIACGLATSPKGVSRRKHISQNFLAFEYGVKPLMSDVQSSMELLTSDPGRQPIFSTGRSDLYGRSSSVVNNGLFSSSSSSSWSGSVSIRVQAWLRIHNPDIFLANKLGLIDLALPWKLLPFSFIVDWFVNVEDVISSLTDWYGCTLEQPCTSEMVRGSYRSFTRTIQGYPSGQTEGSTTSVNGSQVRLIRSLGIAGPTLQVKPFKGFSVERGAQAIALVLSVLGK